MKQYIIALDQGTTSSRCVLFNKEQEMLQVAQKEYTQFYPKPGWVEHDPIEIFSSQYAVLAEVLAMSGIAPDEIAGIGITNQRETTIVWDKNTGKPIYNAVVWQCRRTADYCEMLKEDKAFSAYVTEHTGLTIDAYFSASKIRWILDHVEGAQEMAERGDLLFGTVDSWLIWKLTNGAVHVTDYTNASRTMLFDIGALCWDKTICKRLNIPLCMLPEVRNSSEIYGYYNYQGVDIPIAGIAGDQQAALFGQTCFEAGEAKNTYGTGCFLLMNTGEKQFKSKHGLVTTIAIGIDGKVQYALEGSIFIGGAVVQWLRDEMHLITDAADSEFFASKVKDNAGVYLVPAFTGLGAPHWDMYARGTIVGLTRGTGKNHIIRAALESIAYQTYDVIHAMEEDTGKKLLSLKVDGGASANNFLMQFQADVLNTEIRRPKTLETTALGAAYLAGIATGVWSGRDEIRENWTLDKHFTSSIAEEERDTLIAGWNKATGRAKNWL